MLEFQNASGLSEYCDRDGDDDRSTFRGRVHTELAGRGCDSGWVRLEPVGATGGLTWQVAWLNSIAGIAVQMAATHARFG